MSLTSKQIRFCEEYVIDFNAAQAAIRAGYSEKTARSLGQRLLTNVDVQKYVDTLKTETAQRNGITIDYLVQELKSIAEDDLTKYFDFQAKGAKLIVKLKADFDKIPKKNIKKLHIGRRGEVRIEMYARDNALELLGKHIGFYNDKNTLSDKLSEILSTAVEDGKLTDQDIQRIATMMYEHQSRFLNKTA